MSLPMVKGEITALLGENGAGKTTTMSMLCGLFPATDGQMEVEGRDVAQNQDYMHDQLGVCPQHDVLWQTLSVRSSSTALPSVTSEGNLAPQCAMSD
jgi:ABC-type multidrug transport system ATPase subunit